MASMGGATNYKINRIWSDNFMPSVKSILGRAIIKESSFKQDTEQGFDLITPNSIKIACRVRDYDRYKNYTQEFTIRSRSLHGKKTEIHKILAGFGDWMFYGFAHGNEVIRWSIIDLDVFRDNYECVDHIEKRNHDGTRFYAFKIGTFPEEIIIDKNFQINFKGNQTTYQRKAHESDLSEM